MATENGNRGSYTIEFMFDGDLGGGKEYQFSVKKWYENGKMRTVESIFMHTSKGAEMKFSIDTEDGIRSVGLNGENYLREDIQYSIPQDDDATRVIDYANSAYDLIQQQIQQKAPQLFALAYKATLKPRHIDLNELL